MTHDQFAKWWTTWGVQVVHWGRRGIESRKEGELVERLALTESPDFRAHFAAYRAAEKDAPWPESVRKAPWPTEKGA